MSSNAAMIARVTRDCDRIISNTNRAIRRHLAAAGYCKADINAGMIYARKAGYADAADGYALAMSRILYGDSDLAAGARFTVADGAGPRA